MLVTIVRPDWTLQANAGEIRYRVGATVNVPDPAADQMIKSGVAKAAQTSAPPPEVQVKPLVAQQAVAQPIATSTLTARERETLVPPPPPPSTT